MRIGLKPNPLTLGASTDSIANALNVKGNVRAASTANLTLSAPQTIDGVAVVIGDRVLAKDQTTGSQNGLYVVASGAWTRAADANETADITAGLTVWVSEGTVNADTGWILTTNAPIVLGTTALVFAQFSGGVGLVAGTGLTKTGTTLALTSPVTVANGGTGVATLGSGNVLLGAGTGAVTSAKVAPAGTFVGTSDTQTLTAKRVTPRTGTAASSATPTINTDNVDFYSLTALAVDITSMTTNLTGTPTEGQSLRLAITGTAARAIAWGASFEASTVALPTTTVTTNRLDVEFIWNTVTSKWRCVGVS